MTIAELQILVELGKFRSDQQMDGIVNTRTLQGAYGRRGGAQRGRMRS